jgi:hypothetical protein
VKYLTNSFTYIRATIGLPLPQQVALPLAPLTPLNCANNSNLRGKYTKMMYKRVKEGATFIKALIKAYVTVKLFNLILISLISIKKFFDFN